MKKLFYLFRHGQTDMNAERRWQGRLINAPLNETGVRQAENLADRLVSAGIQAIFTSPLLRAVQTAKIVSRKINVPVTKCGGLVEGCFGAAEGKTIYEIYALFPDIAPRWESLEACDMDVCFPNGETKRQIQTRWLAALTDIAENHPCNRIGISGHSAAIRCTLLAFGQKYPQVPHGTPFCLEWDGKRFSFVG